MKIVVLAVSYKTTELNSGQNGWCVVGRNIVEPKQWIRLVANEGGRELCDSQIKVNCGKSVRNLKPLDVIDVDFDCIEDERGLWFQPENVVLKSLRYVESVDEKVLDEYLDKAASLLNDANYSWTKTDIEKKGDNRSIMLVQVQNLSIYSDSRSKRKADFEYNGEQYKNFSVTDPFVQIPCKIKSAKLCLSLGVPYNPLDENGLPRWRDCRHYKIVAAVFDR